MIIAIDFDGTICRSSHFPAIDGEMPDAVSVIRQLKAEGHYIIIWTCRTGDNLIAAVNWLVGHKIPFDRVNDHNPDNAALYGGSGRKIYAHCYIDDKNLGGFPGWKSAYETITEMENEWKRKSDGT